MMQMARPWWIILFVAVLAGAVALAGDERENPSAQASATSPSEKKAAEAEPKPAALKIGQEAPDFTLLDCGGKKFKLSDYKDKLVVIRWVNKECPWCRKANPVIKDMYDKYADKGVVWVAVDSTYGRKAEDNEQYIQDEKLPFTILTDGDGKVGKAYGAKTTPHIYLINKGKLMYMGGLHNDQHGTRPKSEFRNYLDEALAAVLADKEVPVAETTPWGCTVKYKGAGRDGGRDKP